MRICSHCGGRGKLPVHEIELIDPAKGLVEGNVKFNERGFQPCYTCEGKGYIVAPQIKNAFIGDQKSDLTDLEENSLKDIVIGLRS